ncbi:MAG: SET domain-containing protein-lysine N-methyltransferase [FCB group bacterium]|jgi:SET domain-containing protein
MTKIKKNVNVKDTKHDRDFVYVSTSNIEGQGLFAKRDIPKGTRIIEYLGEHIPMTNLLTQVPDKKPAPVYIFYLTERTVIDGSRNGNEARFINHSCDPNCEPYNFDDRIYIYAMRDIIKGEELTFDYQLRPAFKGKRKIYKKEDYACRCGSPNCRGTMLFIRKRKSGKQKENN